MRECKVYIEYIYTISNQDFINIYYINQDYIKSRLYIFLSWVWVAFGASSHLTRLFRTVTLTQQTMRPVSFADIADLLTLLPDVFFNIKENIIIN